MKTYEIDYSFTLPDGGSVVLNADSLEHAEALGVLHIKEVYPDAVNIEIDAVREVKSITREEIDNLTEGKTVLS